MNLLKNKNFRRLLIGQATSTFGSNMQQFALSLYVLAITGSATLFASMLALSILPRLLLSPIAGVFGDWFDRKKTIVRLDLVNALLIGVYAILFFVTGELSLLSIYILVILLEIIEIFFGSAMAAVVPSMIEPEKLFEANSLRSILMSLSTIASPMIASMLYALLGLQILLFFNAFSFLISAISEMTITIPQFHKAPEKIDFKNFFHDLKEGISIIRTHKSLLNIIGFGVFLNFSLSPLFSVILIFLLMNTLGATEIQFGLISTIAGVSMVLGPILLGKQAQKIPVGQLLILTFFGISLLVFVLALNVHPLFLQQFSSSLIPILLVTVIIFLISMLTTLVNIAVGTLFDTLVPKEFMGRASSVMNLGLTIAIPLGQMLSGLLLDFFSTSLTIALIGVIIFLATLYYKKPFTQKNEANKTQMVSGS